MDGDSGNSQCQDELNQRASWGQQPGPSEDKGFETWMLMTRGVSQRHRDGWPGPDLLDILSHLRRHQALSWYGIIYLGWEQLMGNLHSRTLLQFHLLIMQFLMLGKDQLAHTSTPKWSSATLPIFKDTSCCLWGMEQIGLGEGKIWAENIHTLTWMKTVLDHYKRIQSNPSNIHYVTNPWKAGYQELWGIQRNVIISCP